MPDPTAIEAFIQRWQASGAAERANFPHFMVELCHLLDLPRPDPSTPDDTHNAYVFERVVPLPEGTIGRIDLYRRSCFVLEAKQGSDLSGLPDQTGLNRKTKKGTAVRGTSGWDTALERARQQAQSYARSLPPGELADGRPPFWPRWARRAGWKGAGLWGSSSACRTASRGSASAVKPGGIALTGRLKGLSRIKRKF